MSLGFFTQAPDISIQAITIAADGNAHCQPAFENTLGLLQFMHKTAIPVACGALIPEQQSGATIPDKKNGSMIGVAVKVDIKKFKNIFLQKIGSA